MRDGAAQVVVQHGDQPGIAMNGMALEPHHPEAVHRRIAGGVVGVGGGLDTEALGPPAPAIRPGDI